MGKTIYSKEHKYIVKQLKKAREDVSLSQEEIAKGLNTTHLISQKLNLGNAKLMLFS